MFPSNSTYPQTPNFLLPNPLNSSLGLNPAIVTKNTLSLNQIENFNPVQKFTDETNTTWSLVKSSSDSTIDIPDPKGIQIVDYWNHEFPNLTKTKIYVYVVEGIRQPRVETEQPSRVFYQWFSHVFIPSFTPAMITEKEWLKANVYAAPLVNARVSKLKAICHIKEDGKGITSDPNDEGKEDKLLSVEELR